MRMRISAIGNEMMPERRSSEAGFSLVEILTALTIMGLMASVVVLSLPDSDAEFRGEVRQLAARLEMAAQESVVDGHSLGFAISDDGYAFQTLRNGVWNDASGDKIFSPHTWSGATAVTLERNSYFVPQDAPDQPAGGGLNTPMVRFDPTGLPPHFTISLERGLSRYVLETKGREIEVSNANL
jgi:type II secretion system protein H